MIYRYKGECVYDVSGRSSDSFIDNNGNLVYLFDIETQIEHVEGVREAEVIAVTIDNKKVPIAHIVLENGADRDSVVRVVDAKLRATLDNENAIPYAYKIRESFSTSPISGKRDYAILQYETDGFLKVKGDGEIASIDINSSESKCRNELLHSNIK